MPTRASSAHHPARLDRRTRRARAQARDARSALLKAAARVFAEQGFREASVDAIARRAGFSKGAVYWHFASKEELFFALLEERVDRPMREMIALLESAPPERDMAPEASLRFARLLDRQRDLVLLDNEYRSLAFRDRRLRARYARRKADLRRALASALAERARHLGAPPLGTSAERVASAFMALADGLALERLLDPDAVPDDLLGEILALVYAGLVARAPTGDTGSAAATPRAP